MNHNDSLTSKSILLLITPFSPQVAELKKKQDAQAQLLRQKQKSEEASKRLQDEIQRIKTHKVGSPLWYSLFQHKGISLLCH